MPSLSKPETYIGFSIKSGQILWGFDNVTASRRHPKLLITCRTLGDNSEKKLYAFAKEKGITVLKLTERLLSDVVGKENCKVIGLTNAHLAQAVIESAQGWADSPKGGE